jgi:hypothetical protein
MRRCSFRRRCSWGFKSSGIWHRVDRQIVTDVPEELAASIFTIIQEECGSKLLRKVCVTIHQYAVPSFFATGYMMRYPYESEPQSFFIAKNFSLWKLPLDMLGKYMDKHPGTRWRLEISFTLQSLYRWRKNQRHPFDNTVSHTLKNVFFLAAIQTEVNDTSQRSYTTLPVGRWLGPLAS